MKTTTAIYDQHQRMFRQFTRTTTARAARLCPSSGGNECLCHNWSDLPSQPGAAAASALWRQRWDWWRGIDAAYAAAFKAAEHATHAQRFRPLWCSLCKAEHVERRRAEPLP